MGQPDFLDLPTFLRKFEQRTSGIMWLLGAGASRASGIKTADDMIWDFKARLYRSDRKVPASALSDLGDPRIRETLQIFFDAKGTFPALNAEDEYSRYFEVTYPQAQDRRRYIDDLMRAAKPSFGHMALANLIKLDLTRIVWTTNFDRVLEDAIARVMETNSVLTVGDLGEPERVRTALSQQRWPIYAKLHGDFQSEKLKNTGDELSEQDAAMRDMFLDACRNQGLAITGYSGRDHSVVDVLRQAINDGAGFPNGLFWFVREQDNIYSAVDKLIAEAKHAGVDATFVKAESFDELLSDVVRYLPATEKLAIKLDDKRKIAPRKIDLSQRASKLPFVRTNAIPILEYPQTCRLVDCDIGGMQEIQDALQAAGSNLIAARIKKGLLAFGDDNEIKRVFGSRNLGKLDTHGILSERLQFESGERSLLRDALFSALSMYCGLEVVRDRNRRLFRPDRGSPVFDTRPLLSATCRTHGVLTDVDVGWAEACQLRLDFRLDRLWLLLTPVVTVDISDEMTDAVRQTAKDFVRERRVKRYNKLSNAVLDGWINLIFGETRDTIALGINGGTGIGARFELLPVTGFSGLAS